MASEIAQTVDHALLTLIAAANDGPRTIRDIGEHLQVGPGVARRVVITLHRTGMLRRCEDGRYDIGPRLIAMTENLIARFAVMAHPAMEALAGTTGRSVLLTGFLADSAVVIHQVDPSPLELHIEYCTGYSRELTDGSDGLVILANIDAPRRSRLVAGYGVAGLAERLDRIRAAGHLVAANPAWGDLPGLSAPVCDENLGIIGSLTVVGHDLDDRFARVAPAAVRAGQTVGALSTELTRGPDGGRDTQP